MTAIEKKMKQIEKNIELCKKEEAQYSERLMEELKYSNFNYPKLQSLLDSMYEYGRKAEEFKSQLRLLEELI